MKTFIFSIICAALFIITKAQEQKPDALSILNKMIINSEKVNTLQFRADMKERFNGKMQIQKSFVKVQHKPFKIYYRQDYPQVGIEILLIDGVNNNKALVKPNQFPWINLNLNPYHKELRVKQHHTLYNPGFRYLVEIISYLKKRYDDISEYVVYNGEEKAGGTDCHKITLTNPEFNYISYTVRAGENIDDIARKLYINSYMILELNNDVRSYDDISVGQKIIIPDSYANKLVLYIDKNRFIPVKMKIYDDKGLYEQYEFFDLEINKKFENEEFHPDFKDYKF